MTNRPLTISIREIARAVDKAVKITSEKHGVKFAEQFTINPGLIMGRWLLQDIKVSLAEQIATEIAQNAEAALVVGVDAKAAARPPLNAVVLGTGGHVICGFWPGPEWSVKE